MLSLTRAVRRCHGGVLRRCLGSTIVRSAQPLLQPPSSDEAAIELHDCGLDLDMPGVPTLAVIGPSRRGKSVLAGLLAGGNPGLFPQSHSSFQAKTSGTHICEVVGGAPRGMNLRVIDTEGLSHVGRGRKRESMVRQFLISTYLTSSWMIWLDTEVLSSGFFNTMWLVHDYVVDVLRVKNVGSNRLPRMMYVRTQETDVQRQEYSGEFGSFAEFFQRVLDTHEDADILNQMFAPDGIHGHALPVWTLEDLSSFEAGAFWEPGHSSAFKESVRQLRDTMLPDDEAQNASAETGPPLLALSALEPHLEKIARLEAFDPRDHEANKVGRLRAHLRGSYGHPLKSALWLADLFDPADREVRRHNFCIHKVALARIHEQCRLLRLEPEVALADPDVSTVLERFVRAAEIFTAAKEAFACEAFTEKHILHTAMRCWQLRPDLAAAELAEKFAAAETAFLDATGLARSDFKDLRLHSTTKWRIEHCVMQLRGRVSGELHVPQPCPESGNQPQLVPTSVWRIGEWPALVEQGGKGGRLRRPEYALWTDGAAWKVYEEKWDPRREGGKFIGTLREEGILSSGEGPIPVPV